MTPLAPLPPRRSRPRRSPPRDGASRGFTLIELTVTLALVGMIMATIYVVLFGTIESRRKLETRVMGSRIGPLLLDAIERDVRQLFIYNVDHGHVLTGEDGKDYGRDADRIMFVAHAPSTSPLVDNDKAIYSNVNEIGYVVTRNEENDDFLVLWRREDFHVDDEPLEGGKGTPLYRRVTQFDIVYYDQLGEEAEEFDDWDSKEKGLPKAMEISLSLEVEPRPIGTALSPDELARRTYSFKRWVTFPQDAKYAVAVRPAVPVPPEEYEQGLGDMGGGQGGGQGDGEGGEGGSGGSGGSGGGSIFGSGSGGTGSSGAGGGAGGAGAGKDGKGGGGN